MNEQLPTTIPDKVVSSTPTFAELYNGIAKEPFPEEVLKKLNLKIDENDIEIRPDGIIFLPEIKYRRTLNNAFGIGGWSILVKDMQVEEIDGKKTIAYLRGALFVLGRYHSEAIGEQVYYKNNETMTRATAIESAKSNCIMRCCKDLGIASELWDPQFITKWKESHAVKVWCEYVGKSNGKGKYLWRKTNAKKFDYPYKENGNIGNQQAIGGQSSKNTTTQKPKAERPICPSCGKGLFENKKNFGNHKYYCWKDKEGCGALFTEDLKPFINGKKQTSPFDNTFKDCQDIINNLYADALINPASKSKLLDGIEKCSSEKDISAKKKELVAFDKKKRGSKEAEEIVNKIEDAAIQNPPDYVKDDLPF